MPLETLLLGVFVIFCRIGGCVMTLPGFSSERIPMRARLFIAIGVTAALAPQIWAIAEKQIASATLTTALVAVFTETALGVVLGLTCRVFMLALETMATAIATSIGLSGMLGAPIEEAEPLPSLASFATLGATTLIFVLDQHWELIRGLRQSYDVVPLMASPSPEAMLEEMAQTLGRSYVTLLRISSPFLLFGLMTNLAFGFLNRMVPQVPVYFVSTPLIIILGVYWFYSLTPEFFAGLSADFGAWIDRG